MILLLPRRAFAHPSMRMFAVHVLLPFYSIFFFSEPASFFGLTRGTV